MNFSESRTETPHPLVAARGPVLVFARHFGDVVQGIGGLLALHALQGDSVHVVALFADPASATFGELDRASACLGIEAPEAWDLAGGRECSEDDIFGNARRLAHVIVARRPTTIYAPWHGELDSDAFVVSHATALAVELADFDGDAWGFETCTPLVASAVVDVSSTWAAKHAALEAALPNDGERLRACEGLAAYRGALLPKATHAEALARLLDLRIRVPHRSGSPLRVKG